MTPESIRRLYDYTFWAGERVWACITPLTDEQYTQDLDYSMGSIRNHMVHLISASWRWMYRLQNLPVPEHIAFGDYPTVEKTRARWDAVRVSMLEYIYALDQAALDERVLWEIPTRGLRLENPRWEILLHVANHATDHRAQVLALLHQHFGVPTVEQDFVFYLVE